MIRVQAAEVHRHSHDIVAIRFLPKVSVEVEHARELIDAVLRIAEGRRHGNLVNVTELMFMSSEAHAVFSKQSPSALSGTAVIISSGVQRVLGNLYLSVARPTNPTKLFTKEQEALVWLRNLTRKSTPSISALRGTSRSL